MIVWKFKPSYLAGTQTRGWFMTSGKQYGLFLEITCERRTGRRSSKAPHLLLSQRPRLAPDFSWLQWVLQRGDKWEKNPRVINIIRLHHHRFPPFFPPQLSLPRQKKPTTKKKIAAIHVRHQLWIIQCHQRLIFNLHSEGLPLHCDLQIVSPL